MASHPAHEVVSYLHARHGGAKIAILERGIEVEWAAQDSDGDLSSAEDGDLPPQNHDSDRAFLSSSWLSYCSVTVLSLLSYLCRKIDSENRQIIRSKYCTCFIRIPRITYLHVLNLSSTVQTFQYPTAPCPRRLHQLDRMQDRMTTVLRNLVRMCCPTTRPPDLSPENTEKV
jgi:hypothetical protein